MAHDKRDTQTVLTGVLFSCSITRPVKNNICQRNMSDRPFISHAQLQPVESALENISKIFEVITMPASYGGLHVSGMTLYWTNKRVRAMKKQQ